MTDDSKPRRFHFSLRSLPATAAMHPIIYSPQIVRRMGAQTIVVICPPLTPPKQTLASNHPSC
jgi:hypothetical protein